ncbi:MAG: hypothetical protein JW982_14445 [Spirochaetes bacterium]|nr:hypothetical protein [Spirochaetota bacterium]
MKYFKLVFLVILLAFMSACGSKNSVTQSKAGGIGNSFEPGFSLVIDDTQLEKAVRPFLTSELSVIRSENQTLPDDASEDYVKIYDQKNDSVVDENGLPKRTVTIVGKKLIIEEGNENGIYDFNGEATISELNFYAETIVFRNSFRIKKGNINIFARNLEFVGNSQLITTPDSIDTRPASPINDVGVNGKDGEKAGNICLNIENFIVPTGNTLNRFILKGAAGQPAGLGKDGVQGSDVTGYNFTYSDGKRIYSKNGSSSSSWGSWKNSPFNESYSAVYIYAKHKREGSTGPANYTKKQGNESWPSNGGNAIPGGLPGVGGEGGSLTSNIMLPSIYDLSNGETGKLAEKTIGGRAGYPNTCAHIHATQRFAYHTYTYTVTVTTRSYVKGADAEVPVSEESSLKPYGIYSVVDRSYSWIQPEYLRVVLKYASDMYIKGFTAETHALAVDYINAIQNYRSSAEWNTLSEDMKIDLNVLQTEFTALTCRIAANRDYFNNPAGWTPRLSFEVTKTLYEEEVDRSFNIMKLANIITRTHASLSNKLDALRTEKTNIIEEMEVSKKEHNEATEKLPGLQTKSENLTKEYNQVLEKIKELEEELLKKAEAEAKGPAWKQAARTLATVASLCPVGQPAVSSCASLLNVIANCNGPSDFLSWDGIMKLGSACGKLNGDFSSETIDFNSEYQEVIDQIKKGIFEGKSWEERLHTVTNLYEKGNVVYNWYDDFKNTIQPKKAPMSEIEKEFNKLKNSCPEYKELTKRSEELLKSIMEVNSQIETAMDTIRKATIAVQVGMLTINSINADLENGAQVISKPTIMYIEEMDRKAREKLLLYHYYMAKAYEYRLIEAYPENLDVNSLYERLLAILNTTDDQIQPAEYDQLKTIYKDQIISPLVNTIYNRLLTGEKTVERPVSFFLGQKDINRLNNGKSITLNLKDLGIFRNNQENIRIKSIRLSEIETTNIGNLGSFADMEMIFKHSGESYIQRNGNQYLFRHFNNLTRNSIQWKTIFDPFNEELFDEHLGYDTNSLIHSIIGKNDDLMLFAMPSAWSDITISKNVNSSNNVDIRITKARIEVDYCYVTKAENKCEIQIMPSDNQIMPDFTLSKADSNNKKDGSGYFIRTYQLNSSESITVTAPETYGEWTFEKWVDENGVEISSNNIYTFRPNANQILMAKYSTTNDLILNPNEDLEDIATEDLEVYY